MMVVKDSVLDNIIPMLVVLEVLAAAVVELVKLVKTLFLVVLFLLLTLERRVELVVMDDTYLITIQDFP